MSDGETILSALIAFLTSANCCFCSIEVSQIEEEVCLGETFKAECNSSISIDSALFGRMKEGRCTANRSSNLGCSVDVRPTVRGQCDGIRECSIWLFSVDLFNASSCNRSLPPYLEVRYTCADAANVHNGRFLYAISF